MSKQVAKYDQLKDVYVFMNEEKEMVVINADVIEQCIDQKVKANQWIEKESNKYHEEMTK
ncbi:hypothetical protein [Macrococcoides bohemicum]|uniref:hypothetical protein n=1 Tax=Macrococcoides bohemicum TaxID=1903056 RepID=UPI00165DCE35|nr:hypothetical protein [Macrococcus bohemicus]MBC9873679.1 hypothetical protein [Macrococcus bohemicus]